jgi:hypothetical protein
VRSLITIATGARRRPHGLALPAHAAFTATAPTFAVLYVAAGAPSPMPSLLEQRWGFAPWVLTVAFAAYAIGLLAALLVTGSLSDYVGGARCCWAHWPSSWSRW